MTRQPPFQVTLTSKGQITLPAALCRALGITKGTKIDVYPSTRDSFTATLRRPSRILEYAGDLKDLDVQLRKQEDTGQ